jgi:hypothetical protein
MTATTRVLNVLKQFSLSDLGDDWKDCYVTYRPMTVADLVEIQALQTDELSKSTGAAFILKHVRGHVIGGKASFLDESGNSAIQDLSIEDLELLPFETLTDLFTAMTGGMHDPKDTRPAAATEQLTSEDTLTTGTQSSTSQPPESQEK